MGSAITGTGGGMPQNPGRARLAKPVRLEVRNGPGWKAVARFSADDAECSDLAMEGASMIHRTNPDCAWRVITEGVLPVVLMNLTDASKGWQKA